MGFGARRGNRGFRAPVSSLALRIGEVLREHDIVRHADRVVLCVSGGVDSAALLHLWSSFDRNGLDMHPAPTTVPPRIREEEAFVKDLGARLGSRRMSGVRRRRSAPPGSRPRRGLRRDEAELPRRRRGPGHLAGAPRRRPDRDGPHEVMRGCHASNIAGMSHRAGNGRPLLDVSKDELLPDVPSVGVAGGRVQHGCRLLRNRVTPSSSRCCAS